MRYTQAATGPGWRAEPSRSPSSPAATAATTSTAPPPSISYADATNASFGKRRRRAAKEPSDQETDAATMISSPIASEPPALQPGPTTKPRPTRPTHAASAVARATRSPVIRRRMTICSGTEPAIIAATPESMRVSATCTSPTPSVRSATPSAAAESASSGATRSERRATTAISARIAEAARNLVPAVRRGGSVRTAILIARYVEPQTR